jgi:tRNA(adenine34) deaminase
MLAIYQFFSVGYMTLKFYDKDQVFYMNKALAQAKTALKKNEVPVGSIIVDGNGTIIARAHNLIEKKTCHSAHAEILAIQKACKKHGNWRLIGCTIYITLEPCLMCLGLIQLSRISRIVYGAPSTLFGSGLLHKSTYIQPAFAKKLTINSGIKEKDCIRLLQIFFEEKRKKRKVSSEIESRVHRKNKALTDRA